MASEIVCVSGAEAARRLKVDADTIYRWAKDERIAAVRQGGQWRVFLLALENGLHFTLSPERLPELIGAENLSLVG